MRCSPVPDTKKARPDQFCSLIGCCGFFSLFPDEPDYTIVTKDVAKFLDDVHDTLMKDVMEEGRSRKNKVVIFEHPADLKVSPSVVLTENKFNICLLPW